MTAAGPGHLVAAVDRLRADVRRLGVAGAIAPAVPAEDVEAAGRAAAELAGALHRAVLELPPEAEDPRRSDLLTALDRADRLEARIQRAVRDAGHARRARVERGLAELRALESPGALLDAVCATALRALDGERATVGLVRDGAWTVARTATAGPGAGPAPAPSGTPRPLDAPAVEAEVVASGRATGVVGGTSATGGRSPCLVVPVPVRGRVAALLHVEVARPTFRRDDVALAERVGRVAGETFEVLEATGRLADVGRTVDAAVTRLRSRWTEAAVPERALHAAAPRATGEGPEDGSPTDAAAGLTPRQRQTLELLLRGRSNAEIAETLVIGIPTVKGHVTAILRAVGAVNRAEAITRYLDERPAG